MTSYATVEDYERLTGTIVGDQNAEMIQGKLDFASSLIELYLGAWALEVEEANPDILTGLTVYSVQYVDAVPIGVRSDSAGSTAVSYESAYAGGGSGLPSYVTNILDRLKGRSRTGVGVLEFGWPT